MNKTSFSKIFLYSTLTQPIRTLYFMFLQLIPLFVTVGAGCVGAGYYILRLATKNPDCTYVYNNNNQIFD